MSIVIEKYSGKVTPVGNSKGIRLEAAFFKAHPEFEGEVRATVLADGQVLHKLFSDDETVQMVNTECRRAGIGCFDCKKKVAEAMIRRIAPVREKIEDHLLHKDHLRDVLRSGSAKARLVAQATMAEVREAMQLPTL